MLLLLRVLIAVCMTFGGAVVSAQILIGQSTAITGPVADGVNENNIGARLLIDAVNAKGGIYGEKIEILRVDDGFDPKRTADNARDLIEQKKVIALFMTRGTPNTQAVIPLLDKYAVPLIGPSTGAMILHKPLQKYVFNVRSTYQRETEKAVQHLLTIGLARIAVVHAADSFGLDGLQGAMNEFQKEKSAPALVIAADRSKPEIDSIVKALVQAKAQAVIWISSSQAASDGIKALRAAGSSAQVVTLSNNASSGFIAQVGEQGNGVIVSQVFPSARSIASPMVREALNLAKAAGSPTLSPNALEGFASAKVLVEGLRRAGPQPTRAKLTAALETMHPFDLGGLEINYSPQSHSGIEFTELSIISHGQFRR